MTPKNTTSYEAAVAQGEEMRPMWGPYETTEAERDALEVFIDRYMKRIPAAQRELLRAYALERMPLKDMVEPGGVRGYKGVNPRAMTQHIRSARRAFLRAVAQDDPLGAPRRDAGEATLLDSAARVLANVREEVSRRSTSPG